MLVPARLLHDHKLLSGVVLCLLGVVDDGLVADDRLGDPGANPSFSTGAAK